MTRIKQNEFHEQSSIQRNISLVNILMRISSFNSPLMFVYECMINSPLVFVYECMNQLLVTSDIRNHVESFDSATNDPSNQKKKQAMVSI